MELNIWRGLWDNKEWIAPLIASIVMPIATIFIVNKHTKDQIKNQNKENYRPHLTLINVEYNQLIWSQMNRKFDYSIYKDKKIGFEPIRNDVDITIKNIGYGVAKNISLLPSEKSDFKIFKSEEILPFDLGVENIYIMTLKYSTELYYTKKVYEFILQYSDLNDNIYNIPIKFYHHDRNRLAYKTMIQLGMKNKNL